MKTVHQKDRRMTQEARRRGSARGFTLVELLIALMVFAIISAMVMTVISTASVTYFNADARITGQQDMREALRVMLHELAETNQYRIQIAGTGNNQITFQIPIRVCDGGALNGCTVDERNRIIFGARSIPTTNPDGIRNYAIRYAVVANNDYSGSSQLVRRVLDSYPNGTQVGDDLVIANYINTLQYSSNGKTLTVNVTNVKRSKRGQREIVGGSFGVAMRN